MSVDENPDSEPPQPYSLSMDDLTSIDLEAPIRESRSVECSKLSRSYAQAAEAAAKADEQTAASLYSLLSQILQIHFKPSDRAEPYGPVFVADGRRSIIPTDLKGTQSAALASIAPSILNLGVRARLADIGWICDRRLASTAQLAIASYCGALRLVFLGQAELFDAEYKASSNSGIELARRACQIATVTGRKDEDIDLITPLLRDIAQDAFRRQDGEGYLNCAELALDYRLIDPATVAAEAESLASCQSYPETSRHLLENAARAHRLNKNDAESDRCLIVAAECYVAMAAAAGFRGMAAASWLMDAISALRRLKGTGARRTELEAKLREAQSSLSDEMGSFSTEFDISAIVNETRKRICGLSVAQALLEFIRLSRSPEPAALRAEYLKQMEGTPLLNIIPMSVHDDEGKLVAKSPGMMGSKDEEEIAIRHGIVRNEALRRQVVTTGGIEPARRTIMAEHPLSLIHFGPIVEISPFIPPEHSETFAVGFMRFFGGDYISALHILVPQLENSLRYVLKQAAVDTSLIKTDMTQEN